MWQVGLGLLLVAAIWGYSMFAESGRIPGDMPIDDDDFDDDSVDDSVQLISTTEQVHFSESRPGAPTLAQGFLSKKTLPPQGELAAMYLKTCIYRWGKQGAFSNALIQAAIGGGGFNGWEFGKEVVSRTTAAVTPALGLLAGSGAAATAGASSGPLAPIVAAITALVQASLDEQRRIESAVLAGSLVEDAIRSVGFPPMALISYLGAKDGGSLPYKLIDGQGSFLRTEEWGPGIIARWTRAWKEINWAYQVPEDLPLIDPSKYNNEAMAGRIKVVWNNDGSGGKLRPSRLRSNARYLCHPASLFGVGVIPSNKAWLQASPPSSDSLGGAPELLRKLRVLQKTDDFIFGRNEMAVWLAGVGGVLETKGTRQSQVPNTISFEIGHDPGFDKYPTPLLGLLPGNYGSLTFNSNDWRVKFAIPTNYPNSWMVNSL